MGVLLLGTGKVPGKSPLLSAASGLSLQGPEREARRDLSASFLAVRRRWCHSLAFTLPRKLTLRGQPGPRHGEGEAGDGAVSPQRKPPRRAVEVAARLDALRP